MSIDVRDCAGGVSGQISNAASITLVPRCWDKVDTVVFRRLLPIGEHARALARRRDSARVNHGRLIGSFKFHFSSWHA